MKNAVKYFALGLFGLFMAILIAAAMSSKEFNYQQTITIDAPVAKVWSKVNSIEAMDSWNPWLLKDPNVQRQLDGIQGETGSSVSWSSENPQVGKGKQTLISLEYHKRVDTKLNFYGEQETEAKAFIQLNDQGSKTEVTWGFESIMPFPMNAMMLLMSPEDMLGEDFKTGLSRLKEQVEKS